MGFEALRETWNRLGEVDPLWAILTSPEAEGGRWDVGRFLVTGELEIEHALEEVGFLGLGTERGRALDFGCGVGRLTQALGAHFEECHGVDVAASMVELARQMNRRPERVSYHLNERTDLSLFGDDSFDFIYSRLVLQHMAPVFSKGYVGEFVRLIRPGGVAAFQLPDAPGGSAVSGRLAGLLRPSGRFAAEIEVVGEELEVEAKNLSLLPNERRVVRARIRNVGRSTWLSEEESGGRVQIRLGNHWLDERGGMAQLDDGRTAIAATMGPGEEAGLALTVTAPAAAGRYTLEVDLVEEGVAWFADKGNGTARVAARVGKESGPAGRAARMAAVRAWAARMGAVRGGGREAAETGGADEKPKFEMHGVAVEEVAGVIEAGGGRLVAMQRDGSAGAGWPSYFYLVTKGD